MIYDLDAGRSERPATSSLRMTAVTVAAVAVALVFFAVAAFAPGQRASQTPLFTIPAPALPTLARPSFVTRPVPDRTLALPSNLGTATYRITAFGQTGLISNDSLATTYRLHASGDVLTLAWLPPAEALPYPSPAPGDAPLRVRGRDANWIVTDNGMRAIRWLESGMVFEMSSRTLTIAQLADLASRLR
ncbi:MAG: hypothetical protein ACRDF9_13745 [Candidatus Limnocylindria bacterium]